MTISTDIVPNLQEEVVVMQRTLKPLIFALLAAAGSISLAGCTSSAIPYADLRVIHASSMAPNVDVKFGDDLAAGNLAFGNATSYALMPAGQNRVVDIYAAGQDGLPVYATNAKLATNSVVSIFALGQVSNLTPVIYTEDGAVDAATPASGSAKVRVVHGSYVAGPVDVYVTAPGTTLSASSVPTLSNFVFGTITKYLTVPAGSYEVQITPHGSLTVAVTVPSITLASGQLYTAIAVDPTATNPAPGVLLLNDPPVPTGTLTAPF